MIINPPGTRPRDPENVILHVPALVTSGFFFSLLMGSIGIGEYLSSYTPAPSSYFADFLIQSALPYRLFPSAFRETRDPAPNSLPVLHSAGQLNSDQGLFVVGRVKLGIAPS